MAPPPPRVSSPPPGFLARAEAVRLTHAILRDGDLFDEAFAHSVEDGPLAAVPPEDRRLCYAIIAASLRRKGELDQALTRHLAKPLPKSAGSTYENLLNMAAQVCFMRIPPHAAVGLAVAVAKTDPQAKHFAGLINAVGRKLELQAPGEIPDHSINTPPWLYRRWVDAYGSDIALKIAAANLDEPPLDLTVVGDIGIWAARLGGSALAPSTVRLASWQGSVTCLPGFYDGGWWVQDCAAAIPARFLGDVNGSRVLDLCAAPGGKTAQLASAGASVTAVDRSAKRLRRLEQNLRRLKLDAKTIAVDALNYEASEPFDAVLLDAPCSGTGVIRRHPDLPYHRKPSDIAELAELQNRMLRKAAALTRIGGTVVFCTCSIEPEEGPAQLQNLPPTLSHLPIQPGEFPIDSSLLSQGYLRTLPNQGLDGFFAMRLKRV